MAFTSGSHSCELTLGSSTVNLTYEAVDVTGPVSTYSGWFDKFEGWCKFSPSRQSFSF